MRSGTSFQPEQGEVDHVFSKIGLPELAVIFGVALLIFGPSKLPDIGKAMGKGIREFRNATQEITKNINENDKESEEKKS